MWEDDRNRQGGRWLVNTQKNFRQQELDRLWVETVRSFLFFRNWTYFHCFCFESYKLESILIIKVNKLFSLVLLQCCLGEIENMFSMFLSSYTCFHNRVMETLVSITWKFWRTQKSCGNTPLRLMFPQHYFLVLPIFHLCFCNLIETLYMFSVF